MAEFSDRLGDQSQNFNVVYYNLRVQQPDRELISVYNNLTELGPSGFKNEDGDHNQALSLTSTKFPLTSIPPVRAVFVLHSQWICDKNFL